MCFKEFKKKKYMQQTRKNKTKNGRLNEVGNNDENIAKHFLLFVVVVWQVEVFLCEHNKPHLRIYNHDLQQHLVSLFQFPDCLMC